MSEITDLVQRTMNDMSGLTTQPAYLQNATYHAGLGIPVEFFQSGQKKCTIKNWPNTCTTDINELIRRAEANPGLTNYALVAKADLSGYCFLDDDGGIRAAFEAAGFKMQPTQKNQSCSGNFHYIYRHSAKSLAFFKQSQASRIQEENPDGGEMWSLRLHNAYVVGPGSRAMNHQGVEAEYKFAKKTIIVPIPDDLLDFLIKRWEAAEQSVKPAKVTDGAIPSGGRNTILTSLAGKMRDIGFDADKISTELKEINSRRCQPPLPESEVETIANSVGRYKDGITRRVEETVVFAAPVVTPANVAAEHDKRLAEAKSERDAKITLVQKELAARVGPFPVFPLWAIESTSLYDGFVKPICDVNSRYEEVLWMSAATIMLNYLGCKIRIEYKDLIPSIYLVIIGKKGKMIKSSSVKDAFRYFKQMGLLDHGGPAIRNAEGKTIIYTAGSPEGLGLEAQRVNCKNFLLFYDELEQLTKKSGIEGSTINSCLLTMYESGDFSNLIKAKKETYAITPGSYCASLIALTTDRQFKPLWSRMSGGNTGLNDRFVFLYQRAKFKPVTPHVAVNTTDGAAVTRQLIEKAVQRGVYTIDNQARLAALLDGDDPWDNRQEIRAEKWALLMAVDLGRDSVDEECLERGIAISAYERAVKKRFRPYEAENKLAATQLKIVDMLMENQGVMRLNDLEDRANAHRSGSGLWREAIAGLVQTEQVDITGTGKYGDPRIVTLLRIIGLRDEDE